MQVGEEIVSAPRVESILRREIESQKFPPLYCFWRTPHEATDYVYSFDN